MNTQLVNEIIEMLSCFENRDFSKRIIFSKYKKNSSDLLLEPIINKLNSTAQIMETNDQTILVGACSDDTKLAHTDQRLLELKESQIVLAKTEQMEQRLKRAQRLAHVGDWEQNLITNELSWSEEMAKIMEFPVGDSNASLQYFKSRIHPDDLQDILNLNEYSIKNLKPYMSEYRFLRNDGSIQYIQLNAELELDHTGTPIKLIGTAQDVTIRKMTKIKLEKANLDLQKMNVELESFCYSVSHDLRSPLCTIMGLNQIILRNHSNNLNLDIKKSLEMVMKASNRMELVIDGQLDLARLSKTTLKIEEVNLSQIAQDISIELQASNPERNVNFDITPNIKAKGDLKLLSLVLLNLINNSFKFTTNKSESIIEFGILNNNKQITYFVRDNGAGFDMRHSSKLFGAFERLHTEREFPGLGIGLSTVERIIKRHAGNIWAEAKPNIGATFYFTL